MALIMLPIVATLAAFTPLAVAFNAPPGVDAWCGKAYRATNSSFDPGGWLNEPAASSYPLLDLRVRPRMNLYMADETEGSFIVDAGISYINGKPFHNSTSQPNSNVTSPFSDLFVDISVAETGLSLIGGRSVKVNTTSNELLFSLAEIPARFDPYEITITGASVDGNQSYYATTKLYKLPPRNDSGSITKIDSLYGGLLVQDYTANSTAWTALFPYSYYVSWDGWLEKSLSRVDTFKDYGYNMIHIVPNGGLANQAFNFTELNIFLDRCDEIGLWVMYDMRWTYKNLSSVTYQVDMLKNRPSMLLWYTGDEPDGQLDPLNATSITYDHIKSLDPYHPVSLCLNCYNFYFGDYSSGADILLSDVYPIGINATFSTQFDTPCNTTYGDCGCDDCVGELEDVSLRLDLFAEYQDWLGRAPKTLWGVPQAFGEDTYWPRYPTAAEEVVMNVLSVNHGAKGIVMWSFPTEADLTDITSSLSKVLAAGGVPRYVLGAPLEALDVVSGPKRVDAAGWRVGGEVLVSVVFLEAEDQGEEVSVAMPAGASAASVDSVLWGGGGWSVQGGKLVKTGLTALEVDMLIVTLS